MSSQNVPLTKRKAKKKLQSFVVCLLKHAYQFVSIDAVNAKDAKRKIESGEGFDRSDCWDYGDVEDDTLVSVMRFEDGKLVEVLS